jgi:5-carboxymethyl-2-hydroxymuconic-semialdehyde dehydrogenase
MIYSLNGERCTSSSRLLVQTLDPRCIRSPRRGARAARARRASARSRDADGSARAPESRGEGDGYFRVAREEGAEIVAGGAAAAQGGNYVQPTLIAPRTHGMRIAQEEIFGPVLTVIPFDDEAEALRIANDTAYGLAAYLWTATSDARTGCARARGRHGVGQLREQPPPADAFGGMKASGIGRDGGDYSFDFYMETKNVCIALDQHAMPVLGR